jgi:hypothetical protein
MLRESTTAQSSRWIWHHSPLRHAGVTDFDASHVPFGMAVTTANTHDGIVTVLDVITPNGTSSASGAIDSGRPRPHDPTCPKPSVKPSG